MRANFRAGDQGCFASEIYKLFCNPRHGDGTKVDISRNNLDFHSLCLVVFVELNESDFDAVRVLPHGDGQNAKKQRDAIAREAVKLVTNNAEFGKRFVGHAKFRDDLGTTRVRSVDKFKVSGLECRDGMPRGRQRWRGASGPDDKTDRADDASDQDRGFVP